MPIEVSNVTHIYSPKTPFETTALRNVSIRINDGDFLGLVGHTGSGKSTLIQTFNGLVKPTRGNVIVDDIEVTSGRKNLKPLRGKVGIIFQYPEHQLFEETVEEDIAFGPSNFGIEPDEIRVRIEKALNLVGLSRNIYGKRSPFDLSGGEMRRVAIAGVLAIQPKYLVLDEPTAGLDPGGREQILTLLRKLHESNITIIMVSHSMEDIARVCNRVAVMHEGEILLDGNPQTVFGNIDVLQKCGLDIPDVSRLMFGLKSRGFNVSTSVLTPEEAAQNIIKAINGGYRK